MLKFHKIDVYFIMKEIPSTLENSASLKNFCTLFFAFYAVKGKGTDKGHIVPMRYT